MPSKHILKTEKEWNLHKTTLIAPKNVSTDESKPNYTVLNYFIYVDTIYNKYCNFHKDTMFGCWDS